MADEREKRRAVNPEEEIEKYENILVKDPRSRVFAPLAEVYRKAGFLDDAVRVCTSGLEYNPGYISGEVALARALFEKHEYAQARDEISKVVKSAPDNLMAQKLLGRIELRLNHRVEAEKAFEMVLMIDPRDEEAKRHLDEMKRPAPAAPPTPPAGGPPPVPEVPAVSVSPPVEIPMEHAEEPLFDLNEMADKAEDERERALLIDDAPEPEPSAVIVEEEPEIEVPAVPPEIPPETEPMAVMAEEEPELEVSAAPPEVSRETEPMAVMAEEEPELEVSAAPPEVSRETEPMAVMAEEEPELEVSAAPPEVSPEPEPVAVMPEEELEFEEAAVPPEIPPEPEPVAVMPEEELEFEEAAVPPEIPPEPEPVFDLAEMEAGAEADREQAPPPPAPVEESPFEVFTREPRTAAPSSSPPAERKKAFAGIDLPADTVIDIDDLADLAEDIPVFDLDAEAEQDETAVSPPAEKATPVALVEESRAGEDVFDTETLANLYITQGFYGKAAGVYRRMLSERPDDTNLRQKLEEVLMLEKTGAVLPSTPAPPPPVPGKVAAPAAAGAPGEAEGEENPTVVELRSLLYKLKERPR